jgi:uncharacterized protein YcnI
MRKLFAAAAAASLSLLVSAPAMAHVTVQPNEAQTSSFSRFVVRVPNERDDAATTKIQVKFPADLGFVGFQPKAGWTRDVKMRTLDKPIEMFGEKIDEVIDTVTWTGGKIAPGEFDEFGFSAALPSDVGSLQFPAIQTYSSGEKVRWIGPEDAEEPAAHVSLVDLGAPEGEGQLGLLAETSQQVKELQRSESATVEEAGPDWGVVLGAIGIALGAVAVIVAMARTRKA